MLNSINRAYLIIALFLYIMLAFKITTPYLILGSFALISVISYFLILYINSNLKYKDYNSLFLAIEVVLYSLFFVALENIISFYYTGNFFLFSTSDALTYHNAVIKMLDMPFLDAIKYYLNNRGIDDLGMVLLLYPLYTVFESNLILNAFYIFVSLITALTLFSIGKNFISKKYAFVSSLAYTLSSFVLFYNATGLKESFMVMIILLSFNYLYLFIKNRNIIVFFLAIFFLSILILFRPALIVLILISFGIGLMLTSRMGIVTKLFSIMILLMLFIFQNIIIDIFNSYTGGGVEAIIKAREIKGGVFFTYIVNIISQAIGPLPTLLSSSKILTLFYAPGLIYRVLLAIPFWFGVYYIFRLKKYELYPFFIFVALEMSFMTFILYGLELRVAMPHLPFIFLIAFWFIDKFDNKEVVTKNRDTFVDLFYLGLVILAILMAYWNFR